MWAGGKSKAGPGIGIDARRYERHTTDLVRSSLGDVVDLSGSGIRVRCQGKPPLQVGQTASITLRFGDQQMTLVAQARWIRRRGLLHGGLRGQFEVGMRFLQLTPAKEKALASIGKFGFVETASSVRESKLRDQARSKTQAPPPPPVSMTIDLPDHYAALGIAPEADIDEVKAAFRRLARQYHPDTTTDPDGEAKFQEIRAAYAILGDAARRRSYDLMRSR